MTSASSSMSSADQRPHATLLAFARMLVLGIGLLTILLFLAGVPGYYRYLLVTADTRALADLGIGLGAAAAYRLVLSLVVILIHGAFSTFIFWRQRHDWMVLFMSLVLITNGALFPLSMEQAGNRDQTVWLALAHLIVFLALASSINLLFLFPSGSLQPRWTLFVAVGWTLIVLFGVSAIYVMPEARRALQTPVLLAAVAGSMIGIYAQVYRYRRASTPIERQQVKWAFLGLMAAAFGPLLYLLAFAPEAEVVARQAPNLLNQRLGGSFFSLSHVVRLIGVTLFSVALTLLPLSFAIAILRYRLWDIDIIIRRTLTYAVLTAVLAFFYFAFVILTGTLFFLVVGETSSIGIVISTLAIAALFSPMRRRVQDGIDRRFYRRKYDAMQTLSTFAQAARDETNLDCLTGELVRVVKETMQPDQVILWLKPTPADRHRRTQVSR